METIMENSLKLRYDMIFDKSPAWRQDETDTDCNQSSISVEEMNKRLEERDAHWKERLDKEQSQAKKEGFEQGMAEGKKAGRDESLKQLSTVEKMMEELNDEFDQTMNDLKPYMADLVFDFVEKILKIPVKHDKLQQHVKEDIRDIVGNLNDELHINISLCTDDFEMIEQVFKNNNRPGHINLRAEEELLPGEYAVETKRECIVRDFEKIIRDFKESISFADIKTLNMPE